MRSRLGTSTSTGSALSSEPAANTHALLAEPVAEVEKRGRAFEFELLAYHIRVECSAQEASQVVRDALKAEFGWATHHPTLVTSDLPSVLGVGYETVERAIRSWLSKEGLAITENVMLGEMLQVPLEARAKARAAEIVAERIRSMAGD